MSKQTPKQQSEVGKLIYKATKHLDEDKFHVSEDLRKLLFKAKLKDEED